MVKIAIVSFSTIGKYKRMDAGFYLGDYSEHSDKIDNSKKMIEKLSASINEHEQTIQEIKDRKALMIENGEINILKE